MKHERNKLSRDLLAAQAEVAEAKRQLLASVSSAPALQPTLVLHLAALKKMFLSS